MRAVNLLPKDTARGARRKPQPAALIGVVGAVAVTGLVCGGFLMKSSEVQTAQQALDLARHELATIPPPAPEQPTQPELQQARTARLGAVTAALNRRVSWDRVLRQFSQVLPNDVWLTSLSLKAPGAPAAGPVTGAPAVDTATPTGFQLGGYSYSHESVARLLSRLSIVPDLTSVTLQRSVKAKVAGRDIVQFTIVAAVRPPGAAA
jgi:Tfp pilus assembly protein PilN